MATVVGRLPNSALDCLTDIVSVPNYQSGRGYDYVSTRAPSFDRDGDRLTMSAGLVPRLVDELRHLRIGVTVDDLLDGEFHAAIATPPDSFEQPLADHFAEVVKQNRRGQLVVKSSKELGWHIALLGELLRDQSIVVICQNRRDARKIVDRVRTCRTAG